ncbi:MAG TPA: hypothetical protein VJ378_01005, partial [Candidatus Paceibacterota bacterium]|nr:hypothetical protein [Candidatus Paceibacterota bacterium]
MKNKKTKSPYLSRNILISRSFPGKKENKIWEPSKGGIGIRLKTAQAKLYITIMLKSIKRGSGKDKNLIANPKINARRKLVAGPA